MNNAIDTNNCGTCGNVCAAGQVCTAGRCGVCPTGTPGYALCPGVGCADIGIDVHNCGACGNVCPTNQACMSGVCQPCPGGAPVCPALWAPAIERCTEQDDPANCGACGHTCTSPSAPDCMGEVCTCAETVCAGVCTNVARDNGNCGACSHACPTGQICAGGACVPCSTTVYPNYCLGTCVNFATDATNCGRCGNVCPGAGGYGGQTCVGGACLCEPPYCTCPRDFTNCGGRCLLLSDDRLNCGACGHACTSSQNCVGGACVSGCVPSCPGRNCGPDVCGVVSCGTCPSGQSCVAGLCGGGSTGGGDAGSGTGSCPDWTPCLSVMVTPFTSGCTSDGYRLTITNSCSYEVQYEYCFQHLDGTCDCGEDTIGGGVTLTSPGDFSCNSTGRLRYYGTNPVRWGSCPVLSTCN